jgi:PLP dependent protein
VDSAKLLKEIDKQGRKLEKPIQVLLQVHIAEEESKFGLDENELQQIMADHKYQYPFVKIRGLMGMASFTEDKNEVRSEFRELKKLFDQYKHIEGFDVLSMGMSNDYELAIEEGSNMVRIGSLLFGLR